MLDLRRLTLLREVKLRGSMSAAARTLSYSPSAVSQQLGLLEKEVGVPLLERVGRNVRLTDAAERLVRYTEHILSILERAETELARVNADIRGTVRIAAFSTVSRAAIPQALTLLHALHPDLVVEFFEEEPEQSLVELAARRIDLVIADEYPDAPLSLAATFHSRQICTDPIAVYLPAGRTVGRREELGGLAWVMEPDGTASYAWTQRLCRQLGFEPVVRYRSADYLFHLRLVQAGLAAAFLPGLVVQESGTSLRRSDLFPPDLERRIHAVSRDGSEERPAILACQAAIAEVLSPLGVGGQPKSSPKSSPK